MKYKKDSQTKKNQMLARVDKEVWTRLQGMLPQESSASISRILYNTSLLKLENKLRDFDKDLTRELSRGKKK